MSWTPFRNRQGEPIDVDEWMRLWDDHKYRFLGDEKVGPYRIATIWTGADDNPPHGWIFETSVFGPSGTKEPREQLPATTEAEAFANQKRLLDKYSRLPKPD